MFGHFLAVKCKPECRYQSYLMKHARYIIFLGVIITTLCAGNSVVFAVPQTATCDDGKFFLQTVADVIGPERLTKASYAFVLVDRKTNTVRCEAYIAPDTRHYPGSAFKIMVAFTVLREIDQGKLSLQDRVLIHQRINPDECIINWGCKSWGNGNVKTVQELLEAMVAKSNNIAANEFIELLGTDTLLKTAQEVGAPGVRVVRKIHSSSDPEPWSTDANGATARGFAALYIEAATGKDDILSESSRALLQSYLARTTRYRGFTPGIGAKYYHKTGTTDQVTVDGGYFYLNSDTAVVLAGLQNFVRHDLMAEIGRRMYAHLTSH
jgi:beta-lactamase class A